MRLQVLICTFGNLEKVSKMPLPRVRGVGYLISCQSQPDPLPQSLQRDDVTVIFADSLGLSRNRNHALDHCTAEYALICDDDILLDANGLRQIPEIFDGNPDLAIATFIAKADGKQHPHCEWDISQPYKNYNISSWEISLRMSKIRQAGVRFNENFGVGCKRFRSGEENIFVLQALHRGLKGRFFPLLVCEHPDASTGLRLCQDPGVLRAEGVCISLKYGYTIIPRLVLKAVRSRGNVLRNLWHLSSGAFYGLRRRRQLLF